MGRRRQVAVDQMSGTTIKVHRASSKANISKKRMAKITRYGNGKG